MTMKLSRPLLTALLVIVAIGGFLTVAYAFHLFGGMNCWSRPSAPTGAAVFSIVMADEGMNIGYNGSKFQNPPWPVMNVTIGQVVVIHVINNDTQAHGFLITHYFPTGINGISGLAPGACYNVEFTANTLGSFTVECNIFCTIHQEMQYGQLNVNP